MGTLLVIVASLIYLNAVSVSNSAIVKEVVVVIFLVNLDEYLHRMLQILCPKWLDKVCNRNLGKTIEWEEEAISECHKDLHTKMKELKEVFSHEPVTLVVENNRRETELMSVEGPRKLNKCEIKQSIENQWTKSLNTCKLRKIRMMEQLRSSSTRIDSFNHYRGQRKITEFFKRKS